MLMMKATLKPTRKPSNRLAGLISRLARKKAVTEMAPSYGGIDGEERMGTGTAFDTDEAPPVYTPKV